MRHITTLRSVLICVLPLLATAQSPVYGQCGGTGWTGPTTCVSGSTCVYSNDYYSQCIPSSSAPTTTPVTTTSKPPSTTTTTASSSGSTCTISSVTDAAAASSCATVNINGFTVPAGTGFTLNLANGATVNLNGNIAFGNKSWSGPMFTLNGQNIKFNGNGHTIDGGGPFYWDGKGSGGGVQKPRPMIKLKISGTFSNVIVKNSPAHTFSLGNPAPITISGVTIDNSAGDQPNAASGTAKAGANTDGFDVGTNDVTITGCTIKNQDDFIAINEGSNIIFSNNVVSGGHGISIGSIDSGATVSNIQVLNNKISNADQALRIKTIATATGSSVSNVTYTGNTGSGMNRFGVLIDQSYPSTLGTPGTGVTVSNINFVGTANTLSVNSAAQRVAINCGSSRSCPGPWNFAELKVTGGVAGKMVNAPTLTGYTSG